MSLFRRNVLSGRKALNVMVVLSAFGLVPDAFRVFHFQHSRHGGTVNAGDQTLHRLFLFRDVVDGKA